MPYRSICCVAQEQQFFVNRQPRSSARNLHPIISLYKIIIRAKFIISDVSALSTCIFLIKRNHEITLTPSVSLRVVVEEKLEYKVIKTCGQTDIHRQYSTFFSLEKGQFFYAFI